MNYVRARGDGTALWRDGLNAVSGHRDCIPTECPGDNLYPLLPTHPAARRGAAWRARAIRPDHARPGRAEPLAGRPELRLGGRSVGGCSSARGWPAGGGFPSTDRIEMLSGYEPTRAAGSGGLDAAIQDMSVPFVPLARAASTR